MPEQATSLPMDIKQAKAELLAALWKRDPMICAREGLEALTKRNLELRDGDPDAIRDALADQLVLLEAVSVRFMGEAAISKANADQRRALAAIAFKAQAQFVATSAVLHQFNEMEANANALTHDTAPA